MLATRIAILLPLLALTASCGLSSLLPEDPPPSEGKLEVREVSLGRTGPSQDEIKRSADQKRVAFKIKEGGKERTVVDGKPGPVYDTVESSPRFSPDSKRIGYMATRNGLQFVVIDGVEGKGYEPWDRMYFRFSPDSKRVAFRARVGSSAVMVIDGVEGKPYKSIGPQEWPDVFSPDSKRTLYAGEIGEKQWVAVVDGVEGKSYRYIDSLQFSPDSRRVLYEAGRGESCFVVVDGVEGPAFERISMFSTGHFSPDSRRVAYRASRKFGTYTMVVDSAAGKEYEDIEFHPISLSPDSKHLAYVAKIGTKQCVVMDGKEGPLYKGIERPTFSPDGKLVYAAWGDQGVATVHDGTEIAKGHAVFSPDWQHSAYAVRRGLKWTVVHDGKDGLQHGLGETWRTKIFFSPAGQSHLSFTSGHDPEEVIVVPSGHQPLGGNALFRRFLFQ